jgi:hypothetical protein
MTEKKPISIAHKRRIDYYPRPTYEKLVKAYAQETGESKSAVVEMGVKLFFDSMPQDKRNKLLSKNSF